MSDLEKLVAINPRIEGDIKRRLHGTMICMLHARVRDEQCKARARLILIAMMKQVVPIKERDATYSSAWGEW